MSNWPRFIREFLEEGNVPTRVVHSAGMNFDTAVGLGLLSDVGFTRVAALGNNPDVDQLASITAPEVIWPNGGSHPRMTVATSLEAVSTSTSDTAAGTGARTIAVVGLDGDYNAISAIVTMNGTTAVAIPTQFIAINFMRLVTAGSTEVNQGTISIRDSGGGTVRSVMQAFYGFARQAIYTVAAGHTLEVVSLFASLINAGGVDKNVTIANNLRFQNGTNLVVLEFSISQTTPYRHDGVPGIIIPEKAEFSLQATFSATNDVNVSAGFLGKLYNNETLAAV